MDEQGEQTGFAPIEFALVAECEQLSEVDRDFARFWRSIYRVIDPSEFDPLRPSSSPSDTQTVTADTRLEDSCRQVNSERTAALRVLYDRLFNESTAGRFDSFEEKIQN